MIHLNDTFNMIFQILYIAFYRPIKTSDDILEYIRMVVIYLS